VNTHLTSRGELKPPGHNKKGLEKEEKKRSAGLQETGEDSVAGVPRLGVGKHIGKFTKKGRKRTSKLLTGIAGLRRRGPKVKRKVEEAYEVHLKNQAQRD